MSRTDKHAPYWTWATWYEPVHVCGKYRACNLPQRAVRHAGRVSRRGHSVCTWEPIWPPYRQMHRLFGTRTPGWFVDHVGHNPERVRERDELGRMVKEYNATGELADGDFANWQSRHAARWLWD